MSLTDYLLAAVLTLLVIPQLRGTKLNLHNAIRPVLIVAGAAAYYLKTFPTAGHDVQLDIACVATGGLLGLGCALTTRIARNTDGIAVAKAGLIAAVLWIVGMAARTGFEYYATHGGAHSIADFSRSNQITGSDAWTAALLLMALAQVLIRLAALSMRAARTPAHNPALAQA